LKQMLLSLQFKVIDEAENGEIAMHKIRTSKIQPDFLFIDMEMPLMNGIETIKNLKPLLPDTRILMVNSRSDRELVMELINLGVKGFIKKPYDRDTVVGKLTSLIKGPEKE
jgi:DNA-binding NarL/FixJ family response regulator